MSKSHTESTNAADKSIGFEFQYYYFLNVLLNLRVGQSAGLEVKDDVHTELSADRQILFQLKHSINKDSAGTPSNLTELDIDLWKTMHNWAAIISDKNDGREETLKQMEFVKRTEFHIASNKTEGPRNKFLKILAKFINNSEEFQPVKTAIENLKSRTKDATIQKYIDSVLGLDDLVLQEFLRHIRFELGMDDIFSIINNSLRAKLLPEARIKEVFERLDSNIRRDNFISIRTGTPIVISFEEFHKKYSALFEQSRGRELVAYKFKPVIEGDLRKECFIRQLLRIGEIENDDDPLIIKYTTEKIQLALNLQQWLDGGYLVNDQIDCFHDEAKNLWENEFRSTFRRRATLSEEDILEKAVNLIDELRRHKITLAGQALSISFSNGELYHLSNIPVIGWHPDWEGEFKG